MNKAKIHGTFAFLLVLSIIIAMAIPAFAEKAVKVKLDIAGENGQVFVRLTAPAGSDIAAVKAKLKFDTSKLEFNSISYLKGQNIMSYDKVDETAGGFVTANFIMADSLTEKSKMFTYIFDVKDGAEGNVAFDFAELEAYSSENEAITLTFDGEKTVALSELAPLTPDVTQPEPTKPSTEPAESDTAAPEKDDPKIPATTGRVIAVSAVCAVCVFALAGGTVYASKKKRDSK